MGKVTIYQQACNKVGGFQQMGGHFLRTLVINGKSKSAHENYPRQMAKLALHFKKSPLELEPIGPEEYLYHLMKTGKTTSSQSEFKHLVYGLRKLYLLHGLGARHIVLPSIPHSKALPVVLSQEEVKRVLHTPKQLWERVFYAMAYDTGIRISELASVCVCDVDL
jgi:integrase/recombinase XerD